MRKLLCSISLILLIVFLIFFNTTILQAHYGTFFRPRSVTFDSTFELALSNYDIYYKPEQRCCCSLYIEPFFQQSVNKEALAQFFLPSNNSWISFKEDGTGNVGSLWFDLISASGTDFSSQLCLAPKRTSYGIYVNTFFDLSLLITDLWFSLSFAAMRVHHHLGIKETESANPGILTGLQTTIQALNNPTWQYGKFSTQSLKKTGVDDIQVKLGYNWCSGRYDHFGFYLLGGIPTGSVPHLNYIFEPLVGTNHPSIGAGFNGSYTVCRYPNQHFVLMTDLKYFYFVHAHELRSFDLTPNGEWSRYLLLVMESTPQIPQPGINSLTLQTDVTPRSVFEGWFAAHYQVCNYHLEVGYTMWWHQSEHVEIKQSLLSAISVYDLVGASQGNPVSASKATISESVTGPNQAPSDTIFTPLSNANLNVESATMPQVFTSTLYVSFARDMQFGTIPALLGLSGSYEFAHTNAALEQWALWVDIGMTF